MGTKITKVLVFYLIAFCLTACKNYCSEYSDFFYGSKKYEDLIKWADAQVFSRKFSIESYRPGGITWPGLLAFSDNQYGVALPIWFRDKGYEIKTLDKIENDPRAIFIGKYNSKGIIIFKNGISDIDENSYIKVNQITNINHRVALICLRPGH